MHLTLMNKMMMKDTLRSKKNKLNLRSKQTKQKKIEINERSE